MFKGLKSYAERIKTVKAEVETIYAQMEQEKEALFVRLNSIATDKAELDNLFRKG